ncbi:EpsG family protein [Romboutsia timonensis]|uniref:EpsG family protein n=1 Tax=Romboutsia timonensis TaxID=1776391 RepID=UPI0008DAC1A5|nr:EpsG family protein [Romboutsia timonensis]
MSTYLINIILILSWAVVLLNNNTSKRNKKIFCIIVIIQWILISGLRHISVGADTYAYMVNRFNKTINSSWQELFTNFHNIVFLGGEGKDPGYPILEKIFQIFSDNYQLFLIFIAMVFKIPMGKFIYKYSKLPCVSFIIYSCLFYSFFSITGHRQTIAAGIALFLGYELIKERKFWKFILLIVFASTIHKSIICLIPFYFIANKKITWRYSLSMLSSFILIFIFKNKVMKSLAFFAGYENYSEQFQGAGTWTFTFIFIMVILVALWQAPKILKENNKDITIWYNAIFMALLFIPLTYVDPSAMRIVQYFSIFIMVLIPEIIKSFNIKTQPIVYYTGISLIVLLFIKGNPQYLFFWQG